MVTVLDQTGSQLRRLRDRPTLILSQDYELFFQKSGTVEKCLFEPCDMLMAFANKNDVKITFFVDAGMLTCMERIALSSQSIASQLSDIKKHIETISKNGHEIGLHVHPHWEETTWTDGGWRFAGTRFQLRDYSDGEVGEIFSSYSRVLNELSRDPITSFRAGGFCVDPFARISEHLKRLGILIDSSVIPGAKLIDPEKGFDFSEAADIGWWRFDKSPAVLDRGGEFLEVPITPNVLPFLYYWGRLFDRLARGRPAAAFGDGTAKAIGRKEIIRRLAGGGRVAELSIDAPKAKQLMRSKSIRRSRKVWQVMGHPKLLSRQSLTSLKRFMSRAGIRRTDTISSFAKAVLAGDPSTK